MKTVLRNLAIIGSASAILAGCAGTTTNTTPGQNLGIGAVVGALTGAAIGHAHNGKDTLRGAAIGAALGTAGGYLWNNNMERQKQAMQQATAGTPVQVTQTADNRLKINIPADAGFATGSAALNPSLTNALNTLSTTLNQNPATVVQIVGHTDNTGSDALNNPLSQSRADSARNFLVQRGVASSRITTAGMGSAQPIADNGTVAGRAANRRVEIYVMQPATQQ